jgi:hypothetical protein
MRVTVLFLADAGIGKTAGSRKTTALVIMYQAPRR